MATPISIPRCSLQDPAPNEGLARPLDHDTESWTDDRDARAFIVQRAERELCLEHSGRPIAQAIAQVCARAHQIPEQLHALRRPRQLVAELEQRGQRRFGTHGTIEPRAQSKHVPARDSHPLGVDVAYTEAPHLPSVERQLGIAGRHAKRGVPEDSVADAALTARAEIVTARSGVDERAPKLFTAAEWTLD